MQSAVVLHLTSRVVCCTHVASVSKWLGALSFKHGLNELAVDRAAESIAEHRFSCARLWTVIDDSAVDDSLRSLRSSGSAEKECMATSSSRCALPIMFHGMTMDGETRSDLWMEILSEAQFRRRHTAAPFGDGVFITSHIDLALRFALPRRDPLSASSSSPLRTRTVLLTTLTQPLCDVPLLDAAFDDEVTQQLDACGGNWPRVFAAREAASTSTRVFGFKDVIEGVFPAYFLRSAACCGCLADGSTTTGVCRPDAFSMKHLLVPLAVLEVSE